VIHGVLDQIGEHALHLRGIHVNVRQIRWQIEVERAFSR
jgi:hypothetical protein